MSPRLTNMRLHIPTVLLPSLADDLRWRAVKRFYDDNKQDAPTPSNPRFACIVVPAVDVANYCDGELERLEKAKALMFFRKVLLLLVGNEDLLREVVNSGRFRGSDVVNKLEDAFDECLMESAIHVTGDDREFFSKCILRFRAKRSQDRQEYWRDWMMLLWILSLVGGLVAWWFGYWAPFGGTLSGAGGANTFTEWMDSDQSAGGVGAPAFMQADAK